MVFKYKEFSFKSGDKIRCKIGHTWIYDGVINIDYYKSPSDRIYICHNERDASGASCANKYGYNYSYSLRGRDFVRDVANSLSDDVSDLNPHNGVKSNLSIDNNIKEFLKITNKDHLMVLFASKIGLYDEYNRYFISEKEGFLTLKTTPDPKSDNPKRIKVLELKFGRFLRATTDKLKIPMNDSEIEKLYNKFVSYQNKSLLKIDYLYGDDILLGYTKLNHLEYRDSSLYSSCMNDKHSFLKIYTKNENIVKLAIMYIDGKIACRTLVWKTIDNIIVHDKIYACRDWVYSAFLELLKKENINPISDYGTLRVKLDKWKFEYYPYLDSFVYLDKDYGDLIYLNSSKTTVLQHQNGSPDLRWDELH